MGGYTYAEAIRGGRVVGYHVEDGGTSFAVNASGLITGEQSTMAGHQAVWGDTTFLGELPYPGGVTFVSELFVVGDDNSLFSHAGEYGPLRRSCSRPV
ncbi:hypothetical protein [Lentzea sp. NPDC055074]